MISSNIIYCFQHHSCQNQEYEIAHYQWHAHVNYVYLYLVKYAGVLIYSILMHNCNIKGNMQRIILTYEVITALFLVFWCHFYSFGNLMEVLGGPNFNPNFLQQLTPSPSLLLCAKIVVEKEHLNLEYLKTSYLWLAVLR